MRYRPDDGDAKRANSRQNDCRRRKNDYLEMRRELRVRPSNDPIVVLYGMACGLASDENKTLPGLRRS
jgi:hypothetical protein